MLAIQKNNWWSSLQISPTMKLEEKERKETYRYN
jgi:hypothetical protein